MRFKEKLEAWLQENPHELRPHHRLCRNDAIGTTPTSTAAACVMRSSK